MIDRDIAREFIENHKVLLVVCTAAFLAVLMLLLVILCASGMSSGKKERKLAAARMEFSIPPEEMYLPAEPLQVPGVQLYRNPMQHWSPDEMKKWYTVPDAAALAGLRSVGKKQVDEILEPVP